MKKILVIILCMVLLGGTVGCGDAGKDASDKETPVEINIGKVPYVHEWVPAYIIKQVAEEKGYKVNIVEGDIGFMFLGLVQGDIDIFPDVWLPVLHKSYMDKYNDKIELAGTLIEDVPIGLAVPSYAPFDAIADLKENKELIDNRIVGLEPSAGMMLTAEKTIEDYGLEGSIELMEGSTPAMLAELDKAIKLEESIVILAWRPHTMFTQYDIKMLEDPKGTWKIDDDKIGVNPGFKDKAPDVYTFLQNFTISIDDVEDILSRMENEDMAIEDLTKEWIENNRDKIDQMFNQ